MSYVIEPNDRAEIERLDREDREEIARNQLAEQYSNEWIEAVTKEPLDSLVLFDESYKLNVETGEFVKQPSTVLDIFNDASDNEDFEARIAQIVIDAHKSGNQDATKLLGEMAVSFGEGKV
jgi:hypothetical protein